VESYILVVVKVLKFIKQFIFIIQSMHFLCTKSLIISYKNQLILLSLAGCLEEKNRQISGTK